MQQGVRSRKGPASNQQDNKSHVNSNDEAAKDTRPQPSPLPLLLILHVILAVATRTFFQPDEYWQSLEIAHRIVFGYGNTTWEWKTGVGGQESASIWQHIATGPIRSVVHPALFVPVYWLLDRAGLDETFLLTMAPRLLQALLSAASANEVFLLARELGGARVAWAALLSLLISPYYLYTAARTFANTAEASLTVFALRRALQVGRGEKGAYSSLAFAACACLIRPTNAILWVFVYGCISCRLLIRTRYAELARLAGSALVIGFVAIASSFAIDSAYHGRLSLPVVPFVLTNVYHSLSLFYGSHPWHWYLSQGLPVIGMVSLPFMLAGGTRWVRAGTNDQRILVGTVVWTIGAYSLLGHKEWRFLQPIVPLLHVLAGVALATSARATPSPRSSLSLLAKSTSPRNRFLLLITLPLSVYLVAFHCIAQGSTLPSWLRREHSAGGLDSVGFLMPCHSTPWQSHLHSPGLEDRMWFISCEPPQTTSSEAADPYMDESDFFYEDPVRYLETYLPASAGREVAASGWNREQHPRKWHSKSASSPSPAHNWPSHIAVFDALLQHPQYGQDVQRLLAQRGYAEATRLWNSLFHDDDRRRGYIVVLARQRGAGRGL